MNKQVIGKRLKDLRGDKSQTEVTKSIGISPAALSMYENGERIPKDDIKVKLAEYYESSVESIFYAQEGHEV